MGAVWRARHAELGVEVAVKFMDAKYAASPALRTRFAREAKAAAGIRNRRREVHLDPRLQWDGLRR